MRAVPLVLKAETDLEPISATQKAETVYVPPVIVEAPQIASPASSDVIATITHWANVYGVDPAWLIRVASCESSFRQSATNYGYYAGGGNPHGIFQFLPQTFYGNGGKDYESYDDQARVAAYMFSIGQWVQWECK